MVVIINHSFGEYCRGFSNVGLISNDQNRHVSSFCDHTIGPFFITYRPISFLFHFGNCLMENCLPRLTHFNKISTNIKKKKTAPIHYIKGSKVQISISCLKANEYAIMQMTYFVFDYHKFKCYPQTSVWS